MMAWRDDGSPVAGDKHHTHADSSSMDSTMPGKCYMAPSSPGPLQLCKEFAHPCMLPMSHFWRQNMLRSLQHARSFRTPCSVQKLCAPHILPLL